MRNETRKLEKLVVLLGPTAAGKSEWGLRLAKKFNGEIVSADSRQIYQKMDIGTAKKLGTWHGESENRVYYIDEVPHHLVDFLDPGRRFTVAQFRDQAIKHIKLIHKRKHAPLLVGGTGLYISVVVDNLYIPRIPPNKHLRQSLEGKDNQQLLALLQSLDPTAAKTIDANNKRRLIRALEVCILSGEPFSAQQLRGDTLFDILQIGVEVPRDELYARIDARIDAMIERGLVAEVAKLVSQKYSWELPSMSGIGYRQFQGYIEGWLQLDQVVQLLKRDTRHFAKRQMSWFRRDSRIQWCRTYDEAEKTITTFLHE